MTGLLPPPRRNRARFMLTPLVDVMFLLLIFFMLSTETSLYTMLRLTVPTPASDVSQGLAPAASADILVSIGRNGVRVNGTATPLSALAEVLQQYKARGVGSATLIPSAAAEVQDIVAVIELFEAAAFGQVRLVSPAGGNP